MNLVEAVSLVAVHTHTHTHTHTHSMFTKNKTSIFSYALLKLFARDG